MALVTGGSRGIGRAVAVAAARRGARLGLVARSRSGLDAVLEEIGDGSGVAAVADVTDEGSVRSAVATVTDALGPVDIVVNNAGIGQFGPLAGTGPEELERVMAVNLLGTVHTIRAVLPTMAERRRGHIVNVGSVAGRMGSPLEAAYSASKFAVAGLSEALAVEVAPFRVGVSLVSPGPVDTAFFETRGHPYERRFPRKVAPEKVAAAVISAVERGRAEVMVPAWMRAAWVARVLSPPLYRWGVARAFAGELSATPPPPAAAS